MALEIYIEDDFEHEAEAKQAADLCSRLSALIPADANYKLLLNFYVDGKQLDALLITPQRFIIIDFKYVYSPLVDHGSTYLAESDTMSPPFSMQDEAIGSLLHVEG